MMDNTDSRPDTAKLRKISYSAQFPDDRALHSHEPEIRQIQLIQLRMLRILDAVCKDYGLTYWLDAGTLLGAIRHQGFIPWDDDVDVVMPRPDYERFIAIAPEIFTEDVFFQNNAISDPGYNFFWTKLRDRRSTAMDDFETLHPDRYHMGVALDVFCFDATDNPALYYRRKRFMNYDYQRPLTRVMMRVLRNLWTLFVPKSIWIQRLSQSYAGEYEHGSYLIKSFECIFKGHFPKDVVFPLAQATFEGYDFPVPGNWNTYLRTCYGDYMQLPPEEERSFRRHFKVVDLNAFCEWEHLYGLNRPSDYLEANWQTTQIPDPKTELPEGRKLRLIYMLFGGSTEHFRQIVFSAKSWLERSEFPVSIHFLCDNPDLFQQAFTPEQKACMEFEQIPRSQVIAWRGEHDFFWRIKLEALKYMSKRYPFDHLIYLDGDTFVRKQVNELIGGLEDGKTFMHLNEGLLREKPSKTEKLMWKDLRNKSWDQYILPSNCCMWNAGVVGLPAGKAEQLTEDALVFCDLWLAAGIRPRLLEQFALSVSLSREGHLHAAEQCFGHYWRFKEEWNDYLNQTYINDEKTDALTDVSV